MQSKRSLALVLFSATSLAPLAVHAQGAPPVAATGTEVGEIIVTAQRREERLIDVPISITAATKEQLAATGVASTRDLTTLAPGLNAATQGFAFQPSIRGITTTSTALGDETNVALYIDNVYIPFQAGNAFALKNIERIEVLKGPQGTLFGRNATGGAIRIVTADPSFTPHAEVSADYGFKLRSREFNAYATAPLGDKVAVGLSAYSYDDDGYVKNLTAGVGGKVADTHQVTLRAKLLIKPSDNLKIVAEADYTNSASSTAFATTIQNGVQAFKAVPGVLVPPDKSVDPYTVYLNFDPLVKTLSSGGYINVQYNLPHNTLTSITSYRQYSLKFFLDSDRSNLDLARFVGFQNNKVFTQEVDLASNLAGPINYVAGIYYFHNKATAPATLNFANVGGRLVNNANTGGELTANSWAGFGEATWDLTRQISVIGGYRYTWEKKEGLAQNLFTHFSSPGEDSWTNSSVRATVRYKFTDQSNVYFTYSTGFKSGAFNAAAPSVPLQEASPEKVKAYEVGLKARLGMFTVLASAFHYNYENIQLQVNNILNPVVGTTILQNAATAKIEGADLQVGARLTDHLSAQLGVSWLPTAKYTSFVGGLTFVPKPGGVGATAVAANLSGSRMIRAPKSTMNLGLIYDTELAQGDLKLSANYFWSDKFFWIPGGAIQQDSYNTLTARVGWTTPDGRYTFSVWGRNLTNEVYWLQAGANTGGFSGSYAQPREIGVGVNAAF